MPHVFSPGALHARSHGDDGKEILVLCHRVPYPPDKGDKIRSYHILQQLKQWGWRIHLGTLTDNPRDTAYIEALEPLCASIKVACIPPWRKFMSFLGLFRRTSLSIEYFRNRELQKFVDSVLANYDIKAVFAVCSPMAEYMRMTTGPMPKRMVLDLMDVDSEKWRSYAAKARWPMSWIYGLESKLLAKYEELAGTLFGDVTLVSESEASLLHPRVGTRFSVHGISNGVDTQYFSVAPDGVESAPYSIVFCGVMDYAPNVDAVCWFAEEVFALVRERLPLAEFWIVGSNPNARVKALEARPGVRVTGAVDDVRPHVWAAGVSVAPLRLARGVQNKVLEAMAMGKAVIVTPQALEGIEAEPDVDLAVAPEDPAAFAGTVLSYLEDVEKCRRMGRNARIRMERQYSWEAQLAPFRGLLE